jgi:hypothetical protein
MAILETRSQVLDVWSAVEVTVEADGRSDKHAVDVIVPKESEWLIVTLTGVGPAGFLAPPREAEFGLADPQGEHHANSFRPGPNGQLTAVVHDPTPGRWTVTLVHGERASAELNVGVLSRGLPTKLQRLGRWLRCKSCKLGLKAAIVYVLVHLLPVIGALFGIQKMPIDLAVEAVKLFNAVSSALGLTAEALGKVLDSLREYADDPIDLFMERLCSRVGLCAR